jgi:Lrp/AsnC family leucine-responsive transcriptional regulator
MTYQPYQIPSKVNLDEKDRQILKLLIDEPRLSVADIARKTNVQRDTVVNRMRRFEQKGLILKYHVVVDPPALGLDIFMLVLIKTAPVGQAVIDELIEGLMNHKNVTHVAKLIGKYDFMLYMATSDMVAFDRALADVKSIKEGVIVEIEPIGLSEAYKIDDFSSLV